ncbi:MAG: response regulator [Myxococcales bacterium]|nr:response regulator [Myxococcales bacterium]
MELADLIRGLGHEVEVAASGLLALRLVVQQRPDIVVTDVAMPDMDGFELAQRLGRLDQPPGVILCVAGFPGDAVGLARARGIRVLGGIGTPPDPRRLATFVEQATRGTGSGQWSGAAFLASVRGPIERVPPVRMLFLAHRLDATGALVVDTAAGTVRIVLRSARVMHVEGLPGALSALSPTLLDHRHLQRDVAEAVGAGHAIDDILNAATAALGEWLARSVALRGGAVVFEPDVAPPAGSFPLPLPIPRLIASGLRLGRTAAEVEREWRAASGAVVRLRVPDDSPETRWGLDATCMRLLRLANKPTSVAALLDEAAGGDGQRRVDALRGLDILYVLGLVLVDGGPLDHQVGGLASGNSSGAGEMVDDPRAARLRAVLAAAEGAHAVDVLGLGELKTLTEEDVVGGYRAVSRQYHPDTYFSAPPLVRALAEACFAKINAAYEMLKSPGGVPDAQRFLTARAAGRGMVSERDHLTARVAFKRAEVLFRNRDWKGADTLFLEALRLDATTWPHAFAAHRAGALSKRLTTEAAMASLDDLQCPDMRKRADVLVAIGNILKLDGRGAEAMRRYRQAAEADPENRDAQREIRLHQSRHEKVRSGAAVGGAAERMSGLFRRTPGKP